VAFFFFPPIVTSVFRGVFSRYWRSCSRKPNFPVAAPTFLGQVFFLKTPPGSFPTVRLAPPQVPMLVSLCSLDTCLRFSKRAGGGSTFFSLSLKTFSFRSSPRFFFSPPPPPRGCRIRAEDPLPLPIPLPPSRPFLLQVSPGNFPPKPSVRPAQGRVFFPRPSFCRLPPYFSRRPLTSLSHLWSRSSPTFPPRLLFFCFPFNWCLLAMAFISFRPVFFILLALPSLSSVPPVSDTLLSFRLGFSPFNHYAEHSPHNWSILEISPLPPDPPPPKLGLDSFAP